MKDLATNKSLTRSGNPMVLCQTTVQSGPSSFMAETMMKVLETRSLVCPSLKDIRLRIIIKNELDLRKEHFCNGF